MAKGKTKLKNLEISKVDFVDEGANQDANILIYKNKEPEDDPKKDGFWNGLFSLFRKHIPISQEEMNTIAEEVAKGNAQSFQDKLSERSLEKTRDEMWSVCYALQSSLISILEDADLDAEGKKAAMEQSVQEFSQASGSFIEKWSQGFRADITKRKEGLFNPSADSLRLMQDILEQMIEKADRKEEEEGNGNNNRPGEPEEGEKEMKIDKSKMTPEDKAKFEELAKSYGWSEEDLEAEGGQTGLAGDDPKEVAKASIVQPPQGAVPSSAEELEKGLHPAVKAELEALRKARESFEERELLNLAKKYEVIGKKADELVPVLKSLKAQGEISYNSYLAVLDDMVSMQAATGLFSEIGKSGGHGSAMATEETEAFEKAKVRAVEILKSRPDLTTEAAIDLAIRENPELQKILV